MWHSFVSVDDDERWQLARGYDDLNTSYLGLEACEICTSLECSKRRAPGAGAADDAHRRSRNHAAETRSAEKGDRGSIGACAARWLRAHPSSAGRAELTCDATGISICPVFHIHRPPARAHPTRKPYATGADRFSVGRARTGRLPPPAFVLVRAPHIPPLPVRYARGCPPVIFTHLRWHSIMRPRGAPARRGNQSREESQGRRVSHRRREGRFSASCHRPRNTGRGRAPWKWRPRSA